MPFGASSLSMKLTKSSTLSGEGAAMQKPLTENIDWELASRIQKKPKAPDRLSFSYYTFFVRFINSYL